MSFIKPVQEHVFVLLLAVLAFLFRENPILEFPQVLWALLGLLSYNLFQHWRLPRAKNPVVFHAASMVVNTLVIYAVLRYSGGKDSALWPLFLLPLFSSIVGQERRTAWLTLLMALVALGSFYLEWPLTPDVDTFTFITKALVLAVATYFGVNLRESEQKAKEELEGSRNSLKKLESEIENVSVETDKMVSLGHLSTSIAHDLNGPIAVILGYTEILLTEAAKDPKLEEDLRRIHDAARFCRALVSNILGLARREDMNFVSTSIKDVFDSTKRLCETQLRHEQVSLLTTFDDGLPDVPMSPVHIQQVMLNLLTNASHVSSPGGTVKVAIRREKSPAHSDGLRVEIHDQGPGLPPEVEKKLFQPFFTTKRKGKGTGMGLYISRRIIEQHHGVIRAENAPAGGSVFWFSLPASN